MRYVARLQPPDDVPDGEADDECPDIDDDPQSGTQEQQEDPVDPLRQPTRRQKLKGTYDSNVPVEGDEVLNRESV
jgi:hypothetical protein